MHLGFYHGGQNRGKTLPEKGLASQSTIPERHRRSLAIAIGRSIHVGAGGMNQENP
jgi:hypothetical protein